MTELIYTMILTFVAASGDLTATTNMTIEGYPTLAACEAELNNLQLTLDDPTVIYLGGVCVEDEIEVEADDV